MGGLDSMDGLTLSEYVADYIDYLIDFALERYGVDFSLVSIYIFLTEPSSSKAAFRWNLFLAVFVMFYICLILVESCDGPNKYVDRNNEALYPFLLTDNEYWALTITCWIPLVIDATLRLFILGYIFGHSNNEEIAEELWEDKFTLVTMLGDILCIFPFLLRAGYIQPKQLRLDQGVRVLLRVIELLSISRILRSTKDIPAVKAIRITLSRAIYHLVLPIFFFFAFNVFAAVIVYFIEPCYNTTTCPWVDLFDASFYSVVTMTTTGYGDQVPYYLTTRMLALVIMIFGALFISLPLAIIGNEYDEAWTELSEVHKAQLGTDTPAATPAATPDIENDSQRSNSRANFLGRRSTDPHAIGTIKEEEEDEKSDIPDEVAANTVVSFEMGLMTPMSDDGDSDGEDGTIMANFSHISAISVRMREDFEESREISPTLLLSVSELRGWLSAIKWQVSNCLRSALRVKKAVASSAPPVAPALTKILNRSKGPVKRAGRLSVFGGGSAKLRSAQVQPMDADGNVSGGHREMNELAVLDRGDSILKHANRLRTISDLSESEISDSSAIGEIEEGGSKNDSDDDITPVSVRSAKSTKPEGKEDSGKNPIRSTFRGIGTIFREQLEKLGDEDVRDHGDSRPVRRLPARSLLIMLAKASKDVVPGGSHSADFTKKMVRAARNPRSVRSRLWMLLELPSSSREARGLRYVLMFLILLSVLTLYTQTLTSLSHYGESTEICGKVLALYCEDKDSPVMDPGCFNQNVDYTQKLHFRDCPGGEEMNCFRSGINFGSSSTNMTCDETSHAVKPFRTQDELKKEYGAPNIANLRDESHRLYAICDRVECSNSIGLNSGGTDGNVLWIPLEIAINLVFSIEIFLRIFVAESYKDFALDFLNIFDMLSIVPFYVEILSSGSGGIDFAVLASSPEPLFLVTMKSLKVFRLFKITRHFKATQVLIETASKVWRQLVGMLSLLLFIITVFAILLYEVEQGEGCYVGDSGCSVPKAVVDSVAVGQFIYINKQGDISQFSNALYGLWFSIVTMTSTGYGDVIPSTNAGLIMGIFLMLFGALYMAMPLTAAASVFYVIHESYNENRRKKKKRDSKDDGRGKKKSFDMAAKKGSVNRLFGGGKSSVTPDPGGPEPALANVVRTAAQVEAEKVRSARIELSAKFDQELKFKMERLMAKSTEISTKIQHFLKDLQCTDEAGPLVPALDQAADIVEETRIFVNIVEKEDITTLEQLDAEFYKIFVEKKSW